MSKFSQIYFKLMVEKVQKHHCALCVSNNDTLEKSRRNTGPYYVYNNDEVLLIKKILTNVSMKMYIYV